MKKTVGSILVSAITFLPVIALAQNEFNEISSFFGKITGFINNTLIPLVFGIALLIFIWGVFKFMILGGGDSGSRDEGKQLMIWAIVGFVVMVSVFGIVNLIASGLGFKGQEEIQNIPNVPQRNT